MQKIILISILSLLFSTSTIKAWAECSTDQEKQGKCVLPETLQADKWASRIKYQSEPWLNIQVDDRVQIPDREFLEDILGSKRLAQMDDCFQKQLNEVEKVLAADALKKKGVHVSKELYDAYDFLKGKTQERCKASTGKGVEERPFTLQVWVDLSLTHLPEHFDSFFAAALAYAYAKKDVKPEFVDLTDLCTAVVAAKFTTDGNCSIVDMEKELQRFVNNPNTTDDSAAASKVFKHAAEVK